MATRDTKEEQDLKKWATEHNLKDETLALLKDKGFDSLEMLKLLKSENVQENFEKTNLLPLAQCLALQKALLSLNMTPSLTDLAGWASRNKLTDETLAALKDKGFNSLEMLEILKPEDVAEAFEKTNLLPMAQCLALKTALWPLCTTSSFRGKTGASSLAPPTRAPRKITPRRPVGSKGTSPAHTGTPKHGPVLSPLKEFTNWVTGNKLSSTTVAVLKRQGFTTMDKLKLLTPSDVRRIFEAPKLLLPADVLALMKAIKPLSGPEAPFSVNPLKDDTAASTTSSTEEECFRFLLLGKTGSGKSTTGNTVLGEKLFDCTPNFSSCTSECQLVRTKRNGRTIEIMDCPGLYDTSKTLEETGTTIARAVGGINPGPHAILYVIKTGRFTPEDVNCYKRFLSLFDKNFTKYVILLFTGPNPVTEEMLKDAPANLSQILKECGRRILPFENKTKNPQPQVDKLLEMVRILKVQNKNKPYKCPRYASISKGIEAEVARRFAKALERDPQVAKYIKTVEKAKQDKEDLEKQKKETEEREKKLLEEMETREGKDKAGGQEESDIKVGIRQIQNEKKRLEKELKERDEFIKKMSEELETKKQQFQSEIEYRTRNDVADGKELGFLQLTICTVKDFLINLFSGRSLSNREKLPEVPTNPFDPLDPKVPDNSSNPREPPEVPTNQVT